MCLELETGKHKALICGNREWLGRRWSSWGRMYECKLWLLMRKDGDKEISIDLVEHFFSKLNLWLEGQIRFFLIFRVICFFGLGGRTFM